MHAITNYPITTDDVDISEEIFGADVSSSNKNIPGIKTIQSENMTLKYQNS